MCGAVAYDFSNTMLDTKVNHMTISNANINVDGVVYYKKTAELNYSVVNNMSSEIIMTEYEVSPESVDIVGSKEQLDTIHRIDIPTELTILTDDRREILLDINNYLPEGVMVYGENSMFAITTKTEMTATKTVTIRTGDIGIRNIPDGCEASRNTTGNLAVVLSGRQSEIDDLDVEKLAPYVDLKSSVIGENLIMVGMTLPEGVSQDQNISVTVVITEKNSEPESEQTSEPDSQEITNGEPDTDENSSETSSEGDGSVEDSTTENSGEENTMSLQ